MAKIARLKHYSNLGQPQATARHKWILWRACAAEDGAAHKDLSDLAMDWSDIVVSEGNAEMSDIDALMTDGLINITGAFYGNAGNGVQVMFFSDGTDVANDTFDFEIFAYKKGPHGPGKLVYATAGNGCALGTNVCTIHPTTGVAQADGLWCDTIAGNSYWAAGAEVSDTGNNQKAVLEFDLCGHQYLYLHVFNEGAGGTEAGRIGAIITAY